MYEVRLRDKGFNVLASLYPLQTSIQPSMIAWDRRWRSAGQFDLVIPIQTVHLSDLVTLGNYIEVLRDDSFEALYLIERTELITGIVTYEQDIAGHINAIYAAGQGTGTLRNVVVRTDANSIAAVGRMESFCDARDVEMTEFDLLRQRADAKLAEAEVQGGFVARAGEPAEREFLSIRGRSLLLYAEKRIILPPPGTQAGDIVDITTSEYDETTGSADVVMKYYTDGHLINPGDGARAVANFVNQVGIPPLDTITFQGRFQTVLEALQEIGKVADAGFEMVLNAADEFEFQVVPLRDRTIDSGLPVVFRSTDILLDIPGREYRANWDVGDLVTLEVESLGQQLDLTIMQVRRELRVGQPDKVTIAFDTPNADALEQFHDAIVERTRANVEAARV